ncbi:MAG: hypothetical protein J6K42_00550 [Clostridia bacterium]|nr:hypothetical protein [Clostridia bacterium]
MEKKEITEEKVKTRLEEIQEENEKIKKDRDKKYFEEQKDIEEKTKENEKMRKKLKDEEEKIQLSFLNKVGTDIAHSKKLIGFIKRYVLIGIVTGVPGIALTYLWDKWQENKMVKDLYKKNIQAVVNPNNRELAKEYEILRRKFYKAYDIDKIEKLLMASDEIEKLKNDNKSIQKLTEEIRKARETYTKNLDNYIENQIIAEQKEELEETAVVEEDTEEELELTEEKISMK